MRALVVSAVLILVTSGVSGADELQVPSSGSIQQVDGNGGMTWTCDAPGADGAIRCNFIQVSVWKPDIPDREAEAKKLLAAGGISAVCTQLDAMLSAIAEGANKPGAEEWIRENARAAVLAYRRLCEQRDMAAALAVVDLQQETDRKTCNLSSWPFALTFKRAEAGDKWDAVDGPRGACGILKVVSLVPDYTIGTAVPLWSFQQRSIVTNPGGQDISGRPCAEWPEERMAFSWKTRMVRPMCEFVKHGLF